VLRLECPNAVWAVAGLVYITVIAKLGYEKGFNYVCLLLSS
jgi:hypothetical protein